MTTTYTAQQRAGIADALERTERYIEKESKRSADLRPKHIALRLEFYVAHRAKLMKILEKRRSNSPRKSSGSGARSTSSGRSSLTLQNSLQV